MKKYILLSLVLIIIFSIFTSCGYKTTNLTETETNNLQTKATTIVYEETTEEVDEEILEETTSKSLEEIIETTSYIETLGTTETMESIATDNGTTEATIDTDEQPKAPIEYNYTLKKVEDQWYMVFNTYEHEPWRGQIDVIQFEIDSLEQFKQKIINNELDSWQKKLIVSLFKRDDIGILIPSMDNILSPILPLNVSIYQVAWDRDRYYVSFVDNDYHSPISDIEGYMNIIDSETFMEQYTAAPEENIYVSEDGTKTIVLKQLKNQYVDTDSLYIKIGDNYAYFVINGMPDSPDRDLIMSFGFEILE